MAIEIEHKFLLNEANLKELAGIQPDRYYEIEQAYLTEGDSENVVRARRSIIPLGNGNQRVDSGLTVKGRGAGLSRKEFEIAVPDEDVLEMMAMCGDRIIKKTRYHFQTMRHLIELDVFHGNLEGLVMAEIEVPTEDTELHLPVWLVGAKNVTQDWRYSNNNLAFSQKVPE